MTLSLYDYYYGVFHPVFNWFSDNPQWWITGFNANHVGQADVTKQVVIASIDFSKFGNVETNELYKSLKKITLKDTFKSTFVYFDDDRTTMWLIWGVDTLWQK